MIERGRECGRRKAKKIGEKEKRIKAVREDKEKDRRTDKSNKKRFLLVPEF